MPDLDSLSRTALIPFWARAQDGLLPTPILGDNAAVSIAPLVKHRFGELVVGESTRVGCCLRNRLFDEWILDLAKESDRCTTMVIDLGVGLDTRLRRQPLLAANYVEVDSEPIIQLRDDWLPNTGAVRISGDGMAVDTWIHTVDRTATSRIVLVLEGVLTYQEPSRVSRFFADAAALLPGAFVLFDSLSPLSSWMANQSAALASGRPPYAWSAWSTTRIVAGTKRLRVLQEKGFLDFPRELTRLFGTMDRIVHALPPMRRSFRLTLAQLPQ